MIELKNIKKKYINEDKFNLEIDHLVLPNTGMVFVLGHSGCGKSTLLNILATIDLEYSGQILINGKDIKNLSVEQKSFYRKKIIGYLHQSPLLIDGMIVEENLLSSFEYNIKPENYNYIIKELDISDILKTKTQYLSGGEKQRVALARVLMDSPKIILADEPTGNLDYINSKKTMKILKKYSEKNLVIVVSHDIDLANKYSDLIIKIDSGRIISKNEILNTEYQRINFLEDYKISKKFGNKYVSNLFNKHKIRNIIFTSFLSLSLIAISCTSIIKTTIESSLTDMFSSYFNENEIVVTQKGLDTVSSYRYDSLEDSYIRQICDKHKDLIRNYKYIYETNFLNLFTDLNDVRLVQTFSSTVINGFDIRNINEFVLTEHINDHSFIDHTILDNDEIIISLNEKQIFDICFSLHIERTDESLFNYLKERKFNISVNVRNVDIGYDEEVMFTVAGFVKENKNLFYHSNTLFNVEIFENEMQLDSTLYQDGEKNPWTLKKSAVLNFFDEKSEISFLKMSYEDSVLNNFFFNVPNENYYQKSYSNLLEFDLNELVCYVKSSKGFDINIIRKLKELNYENMRFSSYGGYILLGNELISGFANQCFLSNSLSLLQEISDLYESNYTKNIAVDDVENVIQGGIVSKTQTPLKLYFKDSYDLKISRNCSDIVVSSYLFNKLKQHKKLYFSCAQIINNSVSFKYLDFNVVDVINNDKEPLIYVNPYFSILLFQYLMAKDYNLINLKGLVFNTSDQDVEETLSVLKHSFTQYDFSCPFNSLKKEMNSTLNAIQIILLIFSILSSLISLILILIIVRSIIETNYRDIAILYIYGINIEDSLRYFMKYLIILGLLSFVSSTITGILLSGIIYSLIIGEIVIFRNILFDLSWIFINLICLFVVETLSYFVLKNKINRLKISEILSK